MKIKAWAKRCYRKYYLEEDRVGREAVKCAISMIMAPIVIFVILLDFAEKQQIQSAKLRSFLSNLTYIETGEPLANVLKFGARANRIWLDGRFEGSRKPEEVVAYYKGMLAADGLDSFPILKNADGSAGGNGNIDDAYLFLQDRQRQRQHRQCLRLL
jgi:hypothetical protein